MTASPGRPRTWPTIASAVLAAATLALCAFYTYVLLAVQPDPGFEALNSQWLVAAVEPDLRARDLLRVGDELLRIGDLTRDAFFQDRRLAPFVGVEPGDHVAITRSRGGVVTEIDWVMPPASRATLNTRLLLSLPTVIFFLIGLASHVLLRPRNWHWLLVVSFSYVMAGWLILGVVSGSHSASSSLGLHALTWPLAAIILDLHVTFPPLPWKNPRSFARPALYGLAVLAGGLELFQRIDGSAYELALLLAVLAGLVLLGYHLRRAAPPANRSLAGLMLFGIILGLGPGLALAIVPSLLGFEITSQVLSQLLLAAVPLLPVFYIYAIYKRSLGSLEFRASRVISVYLFILIVLVALALVGGAVASRVDDEHQEPVVVLVLGVGLLTALGAIFAFGPFQRLVERRVLGVPPAPTYLVTSYSSRIATCIELPSLVHLLRDDLLPGLLVRQWALLRQEPGGRWQTLFASGVASDQVPTSDAATALLAQAGRQRSLAADWVRLGLPLRAAGHAPGLWLFGRRDPDDFYAATEVPVLQALADQMALALLNIRQAEALHALYQANVDRAEVERISLAHELHDGPLNAFGVLAQKVEGDRLTPDFQPTYRAAVAELRQTIAGLRPVMLSYGLAAGLRSLVSDLGDQWPDGPRLSLEAPEDQYRYPEQVETHVYRIVQQACLNALHHAGARTIRVSGVFQPARLDVTIVDDGCGFAVGADLAEWLAQHHFGLVGMHERATLIGGELHLQSAPGAGTRLRLIWPAAEGA